MRTNRHPSGTRRAQVRDNTGMTVGWAPRSASRSEWATGCISGAPASHCIGLPIVLDGERLRWPAIGFLNLYVNLTNTQMPDIRRFERCTLCEREQPIGAPWNEWYRSLPIVGTKSPAPC